MKDDEQAQGPNDVDGQPDVIVGTADPSGADTPPDVSEAEALPDPGDPPGEFAGVSMSGEPSEDALVVRFTAKTSGDLADEHGEQFDSSVFVSGTDVPDVARRFAILEIGRHHPDVELLNVTVSEPVPSGDGIPDDDGE